MNRQIANTNNEAMRLHQQGGAARLVAVCVCGGSDCRGRATSSYLCRESLGAPGLLFHRERGRAHTRGL